MGILKLNDINYSGGGGGSSADHITLTQAEYDVLVQAGTVDPDAFYFIKDTNGDGQNFQPVIYSLEEREIGVWTDGKPLYEKTIIKSSGITSGNDVAIPHNISNIDNICAYTGYALLSNGSGYVNYADNGYYVEMHEASRTDTRWKIGNNIAPQIGSLIIVLRYTKTTDQAGSGTWTPQGVPSHHYSTDEHVVGTWVDGSTIYEKTLVINTPSTGVNSITHSISNLGDVISIEGTAIRSDGGIQPLGFISSANNFGWNTAVYDFLTTNFTLEVGSQLSLSKIIVTVRYTKTST